MLKLMLASAFTLTMVVGMSGAEARPRCPAGGWWNGYKCVSGVANDPSKVAPRGNGFGVKPAHTRAAPRADIQSRKHNYVGHVTLLR